MKPSVPRSALLLALACALLTTGCGRGDTAIGDVPTDTARIDTTNAGALDGLSTKQVEASALPLTPEQAAAMGMQVDTTIHLESLQSPEDSVIAQGMRGSAPDSLPGTSRP